MHQPDYRDHATGEFRLPWVYLHALKDYTDMAWHFERHPGMRAVVNFAPVLLDQIDDYADQFATGDIRDPLLRLLRKADDATLARDERAFILERCFRANHERIIAPFPAYKALLDVFTAIDRHGAPAHDYLTDRFFLDLVTWYHLGWTGESLRRESTLVARLIAKGTHFDAADRGALFDVIGAAIADVIARWSRLARAGQIELSTTPAQHPLAPLLVDLASAREAVPGCPLPDARYPGGAARVAAHLDAALMAHERRFGARPAGIWPAEGAVSEPVLDILRDRGVRWTASGGQVLRQSLAAGGEAAVAHAVYRPWHVGADAALACFFRDDVLSDRIGFEYAKWNGDDAAQDLIGALEAIGASAGDRVPLVSIILDGENCWEYYPYNGYYFLDALYAGLVDHPAIRPTTFAAWLARDRDAAAGARSVTAGALARLVAGSWVGGNFLTWIGSPEKNRAWEVLIPAKRRYDERVGALPPERAQAAQRQLAVCEASDWFWWLSSANPASAVSSLESLFRMHLAHLYALLGDPPPEALAEPLAHGGDSDDAGTMRRATDGLAPEGGRE
jgi:alpha-amylase/alpha-mannosidase (GH57 family)